MHAAWLIKAVRVLCNKQPMAEVELLLLPLIQKLQRHQPEKIYYESIREREKEVIIVLRMIMDFLRDKKWEEGSRISYLLDDTVDMVHNFVKLKRLSLKRLSNCSNFIFHEINDIRGWVIEVKRRILHFKANGAKIESSMRSDCCVGQRDEEVVVGLEEDVELLIHEAVFNEVESLQNSVVRGMVGIGKTTLVRQLYNHADVIDRFKCRAWVCVSTKLSHKEVLMKLIQQVVDSNEFQQDSMLEKMKRADNPTLQKMLHNSLQGLIPYLIVLDDLPREVSLKFILKALPNKGKGSRLLITTRFVSSEAANNRFHDMKFLDSDKSWQLFLKTIFHGNELASEDKFPKDMERRGKKMLIKCGGLPLAIKDAGEQVAKMRQSGIGWEEVLESIDFDAILPSLESSYEKLDRELKLCFLHLGFFKENTIVKVKRLFQFWKVGGMSLQRSRDMIMYVRYLMMESIVEVHQVRAYCGAKSLRINAILHRLSIKKAKEKIGFEILNSNGNSQPSQSPRYRVMNCSRDKFNYSTDEDRHLIGLFFRGGGYFDTSPSYWKSLKQLRILEFEDFGLRILPEGIDTLMELRYLGLRNNYVQELPDSLGCLEHLEVLDISQNFMVEMPDIIWEMRSLRHLYMSNVICRKPLRIDALRRLETLTYISAENWTCEVSGLKMMTSIEVLGIEELDEYSDVRKLLASLAKLEDLHYLILRGFRFRSMPCLDELGSTLPWVRCLKISGLLAKLPSNFPYLKYLKLVNSCLAEDPMPLLEKLPYLQHLKLRNAYNGQQMVILGSGFPELQGLCIQESWNLRNIQVEKGAMSKLEKLEIKNCPYLDTLPEEMGSMTHLKEITMVTTKHTAAKIRKSALISKFRGVVDIKYMV